MLPLGLTNRAIEKSDGKEAVCPHFKVKHNSSRRLNFRNLIPPGEQLEP